MKVGAIVAVAEGGQHTGYNCHRLSIRGSSNLDIMTTYYKKKTDTIIESSYC